MIDHKKFKLAELPSAFSLLCIIAWFAISDFFLMLWDKCSPRPAPGESSVATTPLAGTGAASRGIVSREPTDSKGHG